MFRTMLAITCACILVITSITHADFPAEEAWRVEFDMTATLLGPSWQDDDGETFFLMSSANHVMIIGEEDIVWESPELPGYISAINRVDFGVGDGPEIIATNVNGDSGNVHVFYGEDYRLRISNHIFRSYYIQDGHFYYGLNDTRVNSIDYFEDSLPDSSKTIILGNFSYSYDDDNGNTTDINSGSLYLYSVDECSLRSSQDVGRIIDTEIADVNRDGDLDLVVGSKRSSETRSLISGWYGSSDCNIVVVNKDLDIIYNRELAQTEWRIENEDDDRDEVELYKIKVINVSDNVSFLCVSYSDTVTHRTSLLSLPDLEIEGNLNRPMGRIQSMEVYNNPENDYYFLICINSHGDLYTIYVSEFQIVDILEDFAMYFVDAKIGNFDDDEDMEMAVLTTNAFIMYDLGRLSVPSTSEPPWMPERYAITAAYPNPFNSSTRIEYSVAQSGRVALTVHDLTGREVVRLADGWQNVGSYDLILNGDDLPNGSYLVRLGGERGNNVRMIQLVR